MALQLYLEGRRFGQLTVISWRKDIQRWVCKCDCGNIVLTCSSDLKKPKGRATHQCRVCSDKKTRARLIKDLSGRRFGRLVAIARITKKHPIKWRCVCDCGKTKVARSTALLQGKTRSCGCLQLDTARKSGMEKRKDYCGRVFGKLTVLRRNVDDPAKMDCVCECGGVRTVMRHNLISGNVRSCGCLYGGENHYAYDSSLSDEERGGHHRVPGVDQYRSRVYERDNYTCQASGRRGGRLVVHHIKSWKEFPGLRLIMRNGVTLGVEEHDLFHKEFGRRGHRAVGNWKRFAGWLRERRKANGYNKT